MDPTSTFALFAFLGLHAGAVGCAWGTRVATGSRAEMPVQFLFFAALAGVGFAAWYCRTADLGLGIPSGITLIAMVLMAVTDLRRPHDPAHRTQYVTHR